MSNIYRYCVCTTSSYVACEQRMLNGQTTVDSTGLMHTRYSPDVCWNWLSRVEVHNCIYGQQSDAITSSDILALSTV